LHGEIVMTRTALKGLLEEHDGDDITIKLSAWAMQGDYGPWMRLSWNNYKKPADAAPQPAPAPRKEEQESDDDIPF